MGKYIQLTTPIGVANNVPRIVKFRVVGAQDFDEETPPYMIVKIQAYGPGAGDVNPYGDLKTLCVRDGSALSTVLRVKATPQKMDDQIEVFDSVIGGTPYTTLSAAYAANVSGVATNAKRLQALQAVLVSAGVVSAEFAGT
jgi:hypothetical protein